MRLKLIRDYQDEPSEVLAHANQSSWSAIFSGAFLTAGMGFFFLLLGNAVGLNVTHIVTGGAGAVRFWSWLYFLVTGLFSYFTGPLLAANAHGITDRTSGATHGFVSWGLATVIAGAIAVMMSAGARAVATGTGVDAANWLAVCTIGGGALFAMAGGAASRIRLSIGETDEEERGEIETRKVEQKPVIEEKRVG